MGGRSALKSGAPRLLQHSNGAEGYAYRRAYATLEVTLGPFATDLVRFEAGRVAMAIVQYQAATRALSAAQRTRRVGKGRRPNAQQIERLARRQGLADGSYQAAVTRLEALVQRNGNRRPPVRPADLLAALDAQAGTRG
jgi:hypothetical protein